jgi:hypothetical protein
VCLFRDETNNIVHGAIVRGHNENRKYHTGMYRVRKKSSETYRAGLYHTSACMLLY